MVVEATSVPLALWSAPKMGQAELAIGASAENFSKGESDEIKRLRRFPGLSTLFVRGAESDAEQALAPKPPVRPADSGGAASARARNESLTAKNAFLS